MVVASKAFEAEPVHEFQKTQLAFSEHGRWVSWGTGLNATACTGDIHPSLQFKSNCEFLIRERHSRPEQFMRSLPLPIDATPNYDTCLPL
jgi:hypothetical protein